MSSRRTAENKKYDELLESFKSNYDEDTLNNANEFAADTHGSYNNDAILYASMMVVIESLTIAISFAAMGMICYYNVRPTQSEAK